MRHRALTADMTVRSCVLDGRSYRDKVMESLRSTGKSAPPHPPVVALLEAMGIDVTQLLAYT